MNGPPRGLEYALLLLLHPRDRDTISGDLLEEYREAKLPSLGRARANYWYLRQTMSLGKTQLLGGPMMKQMLLLMSLFVMAAGIWLGVMESILKHDGYAGRSVIAACIALQGLATLLVILLHGEAVVRGIVIAGAVASAIFGCSAIVRIMRAQHFEGFVVIIGLALIVQGGLTVATLLRTHNKPVLH